MQVLQWSQLKLKLRISGLSVHRTAVKHLHDGVLDHAGHEEGHADVDLHVRAQEVLQGEGDDEAHGLPEPVVGERRLRVFRPQEPVQGCNVSVLY
jgi:hypothetical protein